MKQETPFWVKASVVILGVVLVGGWVAVFVFPHTKWAKPKIEIKKTINLSNSDIMVIYENGYLRGEINALSTHNKNESNLMWKLDSVNMLNIFKRLTQ